MISNSKLRFDPFPRSQLWTLDLRLWAATPASWPALPGCGAKRACRSSESRAKKSCFRRFLVGSSPHMTAIADSKHRVTLRQARPGDRFDVEILEEGKYVLARLEPTKPQPSRVRFEKRNGYT